jgi:hypothetical protein
MKNNLNKRILKKACLTIAIIFIVASISTLLLVNLYAAPVTVGNFTVDYVIQSDWGNGATISVTLKNNGPGIMGWTVGWTFPGNQTITNLWNGAYTQSGATVSVKDAGYNASIPTGSSVNFGFNINYSGSNTAPTSFTVNSSTSNTPTPTRSVNNTPTPTRSVTVTPTSRPSSTPARPTATPSATPLPTPTRQVSNTPTPTNGTITIPPFSSLPAIAKLPDPFKFMNGTRMTQKSQWAQRRAEISALAQAFEYGNIPAKPQTVTGSFSSNALTVTCNQNGKTVSFRCSITYPSTGTKPYPAMIGVGSNSLNTSEILKLGVALITFPCEDVASNVTAASGVFYTLYGTNYNAGSFAAWTWGVGRLIDALETTPSANIDPKRLGVTGCSRYGKGAMCVGAFEERIALTVAQEGGVSSSGAYRIADDWNASHSEKTEALPNLAGGTCWMAPTFTQFQNQTNKLPFDTHMIHALCMPRGLLLIENPDYVWLGASGGYQTAQVSRMIFNAFGMQDRIGFSSVGGHGHCSFPASQLPELTAFIQKFLLGNNSVNTNVNRTDRTYTFDQAKWVDWTVPTLQ